MRTKQYRKRNTVEARLGMAFRDWVLTVANPQGLSKRDMGRVLGVQEMVVAQWLRDEGLEQRVWYVEAA